MTWSLQATIFEASFRWLLAHLHDPLLDRQFRHISQRDELDELRRDDAHVCYHLWVAATLRSGPMAHVFISFIHEEAEVATALKHLVQINVQGKDVFLSADQWQVFAGEIWLDRIRAELSEARVVILLMSPRSAVRPWVNFEAGAAWLAGKAVIPACFNGLTKSTLPKPYSGMQALDLPEESYYLVASVAYHLNVLVPPPVFGFGYGDRETNRLAVAIEKCKPPPDAA